MVTIRDGQNRSNDHDGYDGHESRDGHNDYNNQNGFDSHNGLNGQYVYNSHDKFSVSEQVGKSLIFPENLSLADANMVFYL